MTDKNISTEYTGVYTGIFPNMTPREIELEARVKELEERLRILDEEDVVVEITEQEFKTFNKYKQALDEIKSICNKTCEVCQIFRKCDKEYSTCKNARIIDIINKAKEQE